MSIPASMILEPTPTALRDLRALLDVAHEAHTQATTTADAMARLAIEAFGSAETDTRACGAVAARLLAALLAHQDVARVAWQHADALLAPASPTTTEKEIPTC